MDHGAIVQYLIDMEQANEERERENRQRELVKRNIGYLNIIFCFHLYLVEKEMERMEKLDNQDPMFAEEDGETMVLKKEIHFVKMN